MAGDDARDLADSQRRRQCDQAVAEHSAGSSENSADHAALDGALDTHDVDRPDRGRDQHADGHSQRQNQRVRDQVEHGLTFCLSGCSVRWFGPRDTFCIKPAGSLYRAPKRLSMPCRKPHYPA